jgi:hypothetical protein
MPVITRAREEHRGIEPAHLLSLPFAVFEGLALLEIAASLFETFSGFISQRQNVLGTIPIT